MIPAASFIAAAGQAGIGFFTGVPCSFLTPLINRTLSDRSLNYVGAASEGEAVAIAAGAWLAGRGTAMMCQNSGLGNAVNPLTSLNYPFRIPTLLIVTWRGQPGLKDEPQHVLMGQITQRLLDVIEVPNAPFPTTADALAPALEQARASMNATGLPYALVMEKDSLAEESLDQAVRPPPAPGQRTDVQSHGDRPTRLAILERVLANVPGDAPIIVTTGKAGRELFTLADREQHLYQVGSMGCASPMGLGVALTTGRRTIVLDGDGAALMKLGSLATIGAYQPAGLLHVILDNGVHDSTGGQATVSPVVDFAGVALACGYAHAFVCDSVEGFAAAFSHALSTTGPCLVHVRIRPGSLEKLGRPTIAPHEVAQRFRSFLRQAAERAGS
ncbi:phosphonopyruvate decarboxylase [Acidisphaera sp. L21]|jgi:phosphonopyruvate decarboxylase|uniref:phosphonopyruvate decarboxylase n=1 Tax=Acidisphaera sp. L21 TaxID=1641851 RepID=UPI00131AA2CE|nr:phosphonopyruvate decarboxylase [Acidisphaera sp. L21]